MKKILSNLVLFVIVITIISLTRLDVNAGIYEKYEDVAGSISMELTGKSVEQGSPIASDVNYQVFSAKLNNPAKGITNQHVSYVEASSESDVKVVSYAALNSASLSSLNTLAAAKRYESENPNYKVIAAVNGDYFGSGTSTNGQIYDGQVIRSINGSPKTFNTLGIAKGIDGRYTFTTSPSTNNKTEEYYTLKIYSDQGAVLKEIVIEGKNTTPSAGQTTVFFKSELRVSLPGSDMYVIDKPIGNFTQGTADSIFVKGYITDKVTTTANVTTKVTIATKDKEVSELLAKKPLVIIQNHMAGDLADQQNAIGSGGQIMSEEKIISDFNMDHGYSHSYARHPRTVVGFKADGSFVAAVIDGRQSGDGMDGTDHQESAWIMKELGCVDAFNLDGGGSSQCVVRVNNELKVVNSPSENPYRSCMNYILFVIPDVSVQAEYEVKGTDATSATVKYNANATEGVTLNSVDIYLNGTKQTVTGNEFTLTNLDTKSINNVSFVANYTKDGKDVSHCFYTLRINMAQLNYKYNLLNDIVKTANETPSDFSIKMEVDDISKGFKVIVTANDPDAAITDMKLGYYTGTNSTNITYIAFSNAIRVNNDFTYTVRDLIKTNKTDPAIDYTFILEEVKYDSKTDGVKTITPNVTKGYSFHAMLPIPTTFVVKSAAVEGGFKVTVAFTDTLESVVKMYLVEGQNKHEMTKVKAGSYEITFTGLTEDKKYTYTLEIVAQTRPNGSGGWDELNQALTTEYTYNHIGKAKEAAKDLVVACSEEGTDMQIKVTFTDPDKTATEVKVYVNGEVVVLTKVSDSEYKVVLSNAKKGYYTIKAEVTYVVSGVTGKLEKEQTYTNGKVNTPPSNVKIEYEKDEATNSVKIKVTVTDSDSAITEFYIMAKANKKILTKVGNSYEVVIGELTDKEEIRFTYGYKYIEIGEIEKEITNTTEQKYTYEVTPVEEPPVENKCDKTEAAALIMPVLTAFGLVFVYRRRKSII